MPLSPFEESLFPRWLTEYASPPICPETSRLFHINWPVDADPVITEYVPPRQTRKLLPLRELFAAASAAQSARQTPDWILRNKRHRK